MRKNENEVTQNVVSSLRGEKKEKKVGRRKGIMEPEVREGTGKVIKNHYVINWT